MKSARLLFSLIAALGVIVIGAGALSGAAWASKGSEWSVFVKVFIPCAAAWMAFSYGAYRGLAGGNGAQVFLFWANLVLIVFIFPVGTALAAWAVWLWRDLKREAAPSR